MKNKQISGSYTISELEQLTGLSRRTIHFYTKKEVIPPPRGKGGGATYSREHLLRLLLTVKLKRTHLKLTGIREALDSMSLAEMEQLLRTGREDEHKWDSPALSVWLEGDAKPLHHMDYDTSENIRERAKKSRMRQREFGQLRESASDRDMSSPTAPPEKTAALKRKPELIDTEWRRFQAAEGVEVNVRNDVLKKSRTSLKKWLQKLGEMLESDS
jgi:DNA-binding transcriptional MerR regulator